MAAVSDMVERVARAIFDASDHETSDCIDMARAAIAAMREPTAAMAEAGKVPITIVATIPPSDEPKPLYGVQVWQAMIDAALE